MQWYYSADGAAVGPRTADDLEELYAAAEIAADTLVWRKGFAEWTPLGDTEEFAPLIDAGLPPPLPRARRPATAYGADDDLDRRGADSNHDGARAAFPFTTATVAPVLAGPWTRYFARSIDLILIVLALSVGVYGVLPVVSPRYFLNIHLANPTAILIWLFPLAVLTNGIIITLFGNSLGKAIFAIRAEPNDPDTRFGWGGNIAREFRVWFQGMALSLPLLSFFTMVPAFRRVLRGAPTAYDLGRVSVRAYSQSRLRRTLGILLALLLYAGLTALAAMDRSELFSGGVTRSDVGLSSQPARAVPYSNDDLRPTIWINPATQISTTIPGGWSYAPTTGADGAPLHGFANEAAGRAAVLGVETAENTDMATYTAALTRGMSRSITLGDWSLSNLPGVWTASGQFLSDGSRATVYAAQTGNQFWRILYIDQFSTTPGQIAEPELSAALFRSVGIDVGI